MSPSAGTSARPYTGVRVDAKSRPAVDQDPAQERVAGEVFLRVLDEVRRVEQLGRDHGFGVGQVLAGRAVQKYVRAREVLGDLDRGQHRRPLAATQAAGRAAALSELSCPAWICVGASETPNGGDEPKAEGESDREREREAPHRLWDHRRAQGGTESVKEASFLWVRKPNQRRQDSQGRSSLPAERAR